MAPTRVGLVGLTAVEASVISPNTWAVVAFLPSFIHSPDYEIVAVCNSSVDSARRAIETHGLPATTKAYGNPQDLADDPDVDLVVISVRVTRHKYLAEPALLKKKQVFLEWPMGSTTQESEALVDLARKNDLKTIVGVQARADVFVVKLKEIIDSGKIGRITSSSVLGSTAGLPSHTWFQGVEYYLDLKNGGNLFHIYFAHFLDSFVHVLGDFKDIQSTLKAEVTKIPVFDEATKTNTWHPKNTPDHILVQGVLESGAVASIAYHWANYGEAVDGVGLRWIVTGTEGEVEITAEPGQWQLDSPSKKLKLKLKGRDVEEIDCRTSDVEFVKHLPTHGVNTGLLLDAYAKGDKSRYADFASALKTQKLLEKILVGSGYQ